MSNHEISNPPKRKQGQKPTKEEQVELQAKVFSLHSQRKSNSYIAKELNIDHHTVTNYIKRAYSEFQPNIREEFQKDVQLLTEALDIAWDKYQSTRDPQDFTVVEKVLNRRARMLGLDSPIEVSHTVHEVTQADLEIIDMINAAKAENKLIKSELKDVANGS